MLTLEQIESLHPARGYELRINCPECDDTKQHCYCNLTKMVYFCHKCGNKGRIYNQYIPDLAKYKQEVEEYIKVTKDPYMSIPITSVNSLTKVKSLPNCVKFNNEMFGYRYTNYLWWDRGLRNKEIERYDIRASLETEGKYSNSIIFPIYNRLNEINKQTLKYFVCRKIDNSKPKYVNAPWPKEDTLFIASYSYIGGKYATIVEGIFDALAINRLCCKEDKHDYTGIALLGKQATSQQLARLKERDNTYLIYLDRDALKFAVQLKLELDALGCRSVIITHDKDASDLYQSNPEKLRELIVNGTRTIKESTV